MESQNIITVESQEKWTEDELVEFERVGTRLLSEILRCHKNTARNLRIVYTGTSRTTTWRQKKKYINDKENTKGIKKLETFFQPSSLTTSQLICQESYTSESLSLCSSPIIIPDSSLWSTENL
ncbi:19074_t:CDS:1, partial [Racocetra persica]